jgi:hypothetical protein
MSKTIEEIRKEAVASVLHEQGRQDELDRLFVEDGRDKKDHPMYALYTGLYQSRS